MAMQNFSEWRQLNNTTLKNTRMHWINSFTCTCRGAVAARRELRYFYPVPAFKLEHLCIAAAVY